MKKLILLLICSFGYYIQTNAQNTLKDWNFETEELVMGLTKNVNVDQLGWFTYYLPENVKALNDKTPLILNDSIKYDDTKFNKDSVSILNTSYRGPIMRMVEGSNHFVHVDPISKPDKSGFDMMLWQELFDLTPGAYELRFKVRSAVTSSQTDVVSPAFPGVHVNIKDVSGNFVNLTDVVCNFPASDTWRTHRANFTVKASAASTRISFWFDRMVAVDIDDVELIELPNIIPTYKATVSSPTPPTLQKEGLADFETGNYPSTMNVSPAPGKTVAGVFTAATNITFVAAFPSATAVDAYGPNTVATRVSGVATEPYVADTVFWSPFVKHGADPIQGGVAWRGEVRNLTLDSINAYRSSLSTPCFNAKGSNGVAKKVKLIFWARTEGKDMLLRVDNISGSGTSTAARKVQNVLISGTEYKEYVVNDTMPAILPLQIMNSKTLETPRYRLNLRTAHSVLCIDYMRLESWDGVTPGSPNVPNEFYGNEITSSVSSLTGLNITGSNINPSAQQSFTVSANSLLNNVIVTPPTNYEISTTSGSGFAGTAITLTQTGGRIPSTSIYVRLKAGLADNTYTGNINLTSTGAASKTVALSGTVTNAPTIYSSISSLSGFKYAIGGGPSAEKSITINAVNLTSNLSITAPSNYEISPLSGASFTPISPMSIAQTGGVVSATTVYVRLKAGLAINSYAQNISLTAAGATPKNIALTGNVNNLPVISNSESSISGLYSFYDVSQSTEQSFTVGGTDLTAGIIVTPPVGFEISKTARANFSSSAITLPLVRSEVAATIIYVRINPADIMIGSKTGNITLATTGVTTKNIALSGKVSNKPVITTSVSIVSGLNYFTNTGPSAEQSFTVSGTYLTDNVVVTPSTSFEISTTSGAGFVASPSISLTPTTGTLTSKTIYVRLKAGLTANTYTEDINITASYATDKKVSVSGTITNKPRVTILPSSLSGFTYNLGNGPSAEKTFTVSGVYLSSVILISPPTNYEISTTTGASFAATNPILISQSGGTATQTTIYVRLKAGLVANAYTGDIVVTSTGATTQNLACSGTILDPQNLTVQIGAGGIVKENNVTLTNGAVLVVNKGTTKTFVFTPDYGYEVNTLTLNSVDVKPQISNNSYTTSAINGVSTLSVTFKKMQYVLSLKDASSGSIDLISDYGSTPAFKFTPTSNWKVSTVFYNNVDVTSSLVNGVYTVPAITANGLLNVAFVSTATGAPQMVNGKIKVYTNQSDIIVEGTTLHEIVNIYSITGVQLQSIQSQGNRMVIPVQKDAAYLVKASNMTFKVIL